MYSIFLTITNKRDEKNQNLTFGCFLRRQLGDNVAENS